MLYKRESKILLLAGLDSQLAKTWVYPANIEMRQYQYDIVLRALTNNTLVALPTGLGKTAIASVLMYNFARLFFCIYCICLGANKVHLTIVD